MPKPFIWGPPAESLKDGDLSVTEESTGAILYLGTDGGIEQSVIAPNDDGGNQVLITNWANRAADHGIAAQANPLLAVFSDAAGAGEYVSLRHTGTHGYVESVKGNLELSSQSQVIFLGDGAETVPEYSFQGAQASRVDVQVGRLGGAAIHGLITKGETTVGVSNDQQALHYVSPSAGRHLCLTNSANKTKLHDHGEQTNPTLYLHSVTDPDSDNTQWLSLTHDQTRADILTGVGDVRVRPASGNFVLFSPTDKPSLQVGYGWGDFPLIELVSDYGDEQAMLLVGNRVAVDGGGGHAGNQLILASAYLGGVQQRTRDYGHIPQTNPTLFIHSAVDPVASGDATQWLSAAHNQTDAVLASGKGKIVFLPAGSEAQFGDGTGYATVTAYAAAGGDADFSVQTNIGGMARFGSGQNNPQTYLAVGGNSRHVLLLTTITNRQKSHGHAAQTNPTLFIHSAVDPSGAPGSTYWFSATHNQTDAILASGAGNIELNPASGKIKLTTLPGNFANDAAAAAGGVALNEVYRNGSILMIRVA